MVQVMLWTAVIYIVVHNINGNAADTKYISNATYGEKEHAQILGIYHDCQRKYYSTNECRWAMESNIDMKIPPFVICNLLNQCGK